MAYFIGADNKHRFFSLIFSDAGQNAVNGRICEIDSRSRRMVKLLPVLAAATALLFVIEVGASLAPNLFTRAIPFDDLSILHLAVQTASVMCIVLAVFIVLLGWTSAVRARAFCTEQTHVKIDWHNSVALYLIPLFAFANNVLVLLWIRSLPEYAQTNLLFDAVLIVAGVLAVAGIPRLIWLARQRHSRKFNWRPDV